jgi:hypothetical protein
LHRLYGQHDAFLLPLLWPARLPAFLQKHAAHLKGWECDEEVVVFAADAPSRQVRVCVGAVVCDCCCAMAAWLVRVMVGW